MKINRRKLLTGAAAGAALPALGARFSPGAETDRTKFIQGALGGGGYSCELSMSEDGLTLVTRSDTYQANIFNRSTQKWESIFNATRFSGMQWGQGGGVHGIAVAPGDSKRIYLCSIGSNNGLGHGDRPKSYCTVFRSDDRGGTFTPTTMTTIMGDIGGNRLSSPKMVVDPNNADIVYVANQAGIFWVTYNGGSDWSMVTPLLSALSTCTIRTATPPGNHNIVVDTNALTAKIRAAKSAGVEVFVYNKTQPAVIGQDAGVGTLYATKDNGDGSTTIAVGDWPQPPGPRVGDVLYVAASGYAAIDKSSTVPNPGIALGIPRATGVASRTIYFCWGWGASAIWRSTDGGLTFSPMKGGPLQVSKPKISKDPTGGILYVTDSPADLGFGSSGATSHTNCWRYVPEVAPSGSGLSPNTWTNLSVHTPGWWAAVVPDPKKPGHVVSIVASDNVYDSTDWGKTFAPGSNTVGAVGPDDPPWLAVTGDAFGQNFGDAVFDPIESGKLWMCNGIGVWYTTNTTARRTTWTSRTAGLDSLTTQRIVKAASPNGRIYVSCQDRPFFWMINAATYPARDHPFADGGTSSISHGGDIVLSDNDPTIVWASAGGQIWRSNNSGDKWSVVANHNVNGYQSGQGKACLASISPTSVVSAPNPTAKVPIQHGTTSDGGKTWTWQPSRYLGNPMISSGTFDYGTNGKYLTSDGAGNYYLYDKSNANVPSGGLFKSTDGGANFTLISTVNLAQYSGNICPVLAVMPGFPKILFYAPGGGYSPKAYAPTPLRVSFDAGVTWVSIPSTFQAFQVAFGKAKPGNAHPAIYFTGNVANWPNPMNVYRCDDFDGATTNMHWTPLNNIKLVSCDSARCLAGDPEVYGTVYIGTVSSGYLVGTIT